MLALFTSFITKHAPVLLVYILIMCLLTAERVAIPHFYGKLLESLKQAKFSLTTRIFCIVVGIFVAFQLLDTVLTYIDAKLMPQFEAFVRKHVVDVILSRYRQHAAELDLGNITSKLIKLPSHLNFLFFKAKSFLFNHVLSMLFTVGYLFFCHWSLGSIFAGAFGVVALLTWNFCSTCSVPSYQREDTFDKAQESIQDILYNLQSVYVNRTEDYERAVIDDINAKTVKHTQAYAFCGIPYRVMFAFLFLFVFAGVTWTSIRLYQTKQLSLGTMVSSFMVTFSILRTCIAFYFDFESFIYLYGGIKVVSDYLQGLPTPSTSTTPKRQVPRRETGVNITFDNVTFYADANAATATDDDTTTSHPDASKSTTSSKPTTSQTTAPLFNDFTLHVPAKAHVAIMGGIGSGKTSLAQLLLKLRTPHNGTIALNNVPLHELDTNHVREVIHYVPQHPRLFNRTLWENVSYGNPDLRVEQVYALLQQLQLHDLEPLFRRKMHEPVGKQGSHLSGGQRQMVVLLRAVFNTRANIFILDEPTSALDETSREHVVRLVKAVARDRTLLVITHDESLVKGVGRVVRLG